MVLFGALLVSQSRAHRRLKQYYTTTSKLPKLVESVCCVSWLLAGLLADVVCQALPSLPRDLQPSFSRVGVVLQVASHSTCAIVKRPYPLTFGLPRTRWG
jgi:hypothetical protein